MKSGTSITIIIIIISEKSRVHCSLPAFKVLQKNKNKNDNNNNPELEETEEDGKHNQMFSSYGTQH